MLPPGANEDTWLRVLEGRPPGCNSSIIGGNDSVEATALDGGEHALVARPSLPLKADESLSSNTSTTVQPGPGSEPRSPAAGVRFGALAAPVGGDPRVETSPVQRLVVVCVDIHAASS